MNLNAFSRDDWALGATSLLLVIDLLFLPWFRFSATIGTFSVSVTTTATGSFDGWTAVIAVLACVLIVVDLAVERLLPATVVPNIGGSRTQTRWVLALIAVAFVALKFVLHIHFSYFGFAFYAAVVLCLLLVAVARRANGAPGYRPGIR